MDSRCLRGNTPAKKEERDSGKNKSIKSGSAGTLVKNSHLLLSRLPPLMQRRTKTTNKVPGAVEDEDKVLTATPLPRVLISFLRKMGGICPKLSPITAIGKDITLTSILVI